MNPKGYAVVLQQHNITLYPEHAGFAKAECRAEQRRTQYFQSVIKCSWYYKQSKEACSVHLQNELMISTGKSLYHFRDTTMVLI
jgi:hypothetical protein